MNLPQNGKVVVIDNEPQEAEPLLKIFAKNKIPYTYFTGDINLLPTDGNVFDDIRIIFLDINLTDGVHPEAIPAQLGSTLKRIIKPGTPYIAAIWSNNQDQHRQTIKNLFEQREPQISPISTIFLTKSDFFLLEPGQGYILDPEKPNILAEIQERINESLNSVDSAKLLTVWENCIHRSLSKTIFNISNIVDNDVYWNNNLKHVYLKLAHAQLGKNIIGKTNCELSKAALNTISSTFYDRLESNISNLLLNEDIDIKNKGKDFLSDINNSHVKLNWKDYVKYFLYIDGIQKASSQTIDGLKANNNENEANIAANLKALYNKISPNLNFELLFSNEEKAELHPGNVYYKFVTGRKKRKLLETYFPKINEIDNTKKYKLKAISDFRFVELECSPACDYSQSKRLRYRFLSGILFKNVHFKSFVKVDSMYVDIPPFKYNGEVYRLVFDYRLFKALNKSDYINISKKNFLFRLKSELLVDILVRISSHVNRPGIITVS